MTRFTIPILFLFVSTFGVRADAPKPQRLWPGPAPGAVGDTDLDIPTITLYPAAASGGKCSFVLVCPGGGYRHLAMDHEGLQIANWLNQRGISAGVLKYRLAPRYKHPAPLTDAQRGLRFVRSKASEIGIDPTKIGIWGFSAGGHLASTLGTHFGDGDPADIDPIQRVSCRPDFLILAYPVISMRQGVTHGGSRDNLLGPAPDAKLVDSLSNDTQVTAKTPPTFMMHTADDQAVLVENSLLFYAALRKANVPAELHVFEHGRHGVGLAPGDAELGKWPDLLHVWLRRHKMAQ